MTYYISEHYVSPEVAKLLREKGFNEACRCVYHIDDDGNVTFMDVEEIPRWEDFRGALNEQLPEGYISAPTQQMACRWLREEHNIHITPTIGCDVDRTPRIFYGAVIASFNDNGDICYHNPFDENSYNEPEDAIEAALEYCLTNLI